MTNDSESIVWISGATEGLGAGLAATVPYTGARIVNLSRRQHPTLETIRFDLTDPSSWEAVGKHFEGVLANFSGKRAIFIHNAFYRGRPGYVGKVDQDIYRKEIIANAMAPMMLGDMFIRAVRPGIETGLAMISSAAARSPFEGHSEGRSRDVGARCPARAQDSRRGHLGRRDPSRLCRYAYHAR